jgi:hypothetical protein
MPFASSETSEMPTHWIQKDFFDRVDEARSAFEHHFARPSAQEVRSHGVWNYWFIPDHYTYLRASPAAVLTEPLMLAFQERLRTWCIENLGLGGVIEPILSLYVNGCGQAFHNDSRNGRFAYVFSLTRWDTRTFAGGETLLFREEDYFSSERMLVPNAVRGLTDVVPAFYNQLLVFDDRVIHGVQPIQGQMDPVQGRVVLHGHIVEDGKHVWGALSKQEVSAVWEPGLSTLEERLGEFAGEYDGIVSLRLTVSGEGRVTEHKVLLDRLLPTSRTAASPRLVTEAIVAWARELRFPRSTGETTITAPFPLSSE